METFSDITVFVQVVDRGSFTAAAEALELSKGAVSKYVSRLETRLGARLLNRTTRRLTLTEAGTVLYERARHALADISAAQTEVMELSGTPRGQLRVTAPAYFGAAFLAPEVGAFLQRFPQIELDLDLDNRIVDLVKERFDVAIRITALVSSSLVARRLAAVRIVTVASPAYLKRAGIPATPGDLREHSCLHYTLDRSPGEWHYQQGRDRAISVPVRGRLRCNNDQALKQAALDGIGVARSPELFVAPELAAGRLVRLLADFEPPPELLCAVFPARANLAPKVRVFVDFLARQLGEYSAEHNFKPSDRQAKGALRS